MPTRRPHVRPRAAAQATPTPAAHWTVNSRYITFIATWRGQLLVCTIAVVLGAIYFVLREPIGKWRRRQRERLSRVRGEELLSMEKRKPTPSQEDRAGPSSGNSSSVTSSSSKTARERGREKRKEKKRERVVHLGEPVTGAAGARACSVSSIDSSPYAEPAAPPPSADPPALDLTSSSGQPQPPIVSLESSGSESPSETAPIPQSQNPHPPNPPSPLLPTPVIPSLTIDLSDETLTMDQLESASATVSRSTSSSYSAILEDQQLPGKRRKRRSKGRSSSDSRNGILEHSLSMTNVTASSDDTPSPSASAPGSPRTPRRRRELNLGGVPMTPALELLLNNNERTVDSLRAEIGYAKAQESKAREDEMRARDDVRRARAVEDRIRHDYERSRKARDRAETDARRLEAELLHLRSRFDTLAHMYHAVCSRLREVEMSSDHQSAKQHAQHSPHLGQPGMVCPQVAHHAQYSPHLGQHGMGPSPVSTPAGYFAYQNQAMYPSPLQPHGFANFVISPSPHRRSEGGGMGADVLAGPLTPGLGGPATASTSQVSSPYPSDLSLLPAAETPATSAAGTSDGQLSAAELRRLNIASSVLKKKKKAGESENGESTSSPDSRPMSLGRDAKEIVEGLGIKAFTGVQSTFPSVSGEKRQPSKQGSTSSVSSDVSSAPTGRPVPETPSDPGPFRHALSPAPMNSPGIKAETITELECENHKLEPTKPTVSEPTTMDEETESSHPDYAPLFASLAHTPEQLAEIARIRQDAIRDRERRTKSRSCSTSDM